MESKSTQESMPESSAPSPATAALSDREIEILKLVATGASNKQVAQELVISPNTVKVHLRNIFAKIGVASRTEATLYAIREGLIQMPASPDSNGEGGQAQATLAASAEPPAVTAPTTFALSPRLTGWPQWMIIGAMALAMLAVLWLAPDLVRRMLPQPAPTPPPIPTPIRWQQLADLPTARSGLAVAVYDNQIYAIGGAVGEDVVGVVDRYDPATNSWETLASKPVAVADVSAAVIGGQIYVPGGRLASGKTTSLLEVYDPRQDRWEQRAPLPEAVSAYALVAFEGRLYLFGGWKGQAYAATVYEYDPAQDTWAERSPMITPRGFAGAAAAGGKIYILGGTNGNQILAVNEEYSPEADIGGGSPWRERRQLPEGRHKFGIASIADIIHIIGGEDGEQPLAPIEYFAQSDSWQSFDRPLEKPWSGLALAVIETRFHALGGQQGSLLVTQHRVYQAIYTIDLPVVR